MRRLFPVCVAIGFVGFAAVLFMSASAVGQNTYYSSQDALNKILDKVDSIQVYGLPASVSYTVQELCSGITMESGVQGSATNLRGTGGDDRKTFPITALPYVDGAATILLTVSWTNFEHGGFRIQNIWSPSAIDTSIYCALSDTFSVTDSTALAGGQYIAPDVSGSATFRITTPGAGYYAARLWPWGAAHANWITGVSITARVVR